MKLSDAKFGILQKAPVAIFMLVAGADGHRSNEEKYAYLATWRSQVDSDQHGPMSSDSRYEQVWQWLFTADNEHHREMAELDDEPLWDIVRKAGIVLRELDDTCDVTEAEAIARAFVALARAVAEAPTLTFLGRAMGRSVSEEEREAIRKVVQLTRLGPVCTDPQVQSGVARA